MKLSQLVILVVIPGTALAYSPWRSTNQVDTVSNDVNTPNDSDSKFNPSELLDFKAHKPEVYTKALMELKRLEQEPICHRTAAQLLMNNCRGIEENDASENQWGSSHLQRHHVESFANGLTMCDAERAKWAIPEACFPFESSALYRASRDKHSRLDVSHHQVGDCIEALGRESSHWTTWINAREKAVTICRAARLDIEKDQALHMHKHLIELMQQFTDDLEDDLAKLKENLATGSQNAKSFVDNLMNQAESGKARLIEVFESVSDDVQGVGKAINAVRESGNDVMRMFKLSMQTVIQRNAEMAAEQEQALATTTNSFQNRVGAVNAIVGETEASVLVMQDALQQLIPMVMALHERQDALEQKAQAALSAVINATKLLQSHSQNLHQASAKASDINENLNKAVLTARTWQDTLSVSTSMPDWALRVLCPLTTLVLGNFGIASPTIGSNLMLFIGGFIAGETTVQVRHLHSSIQSLLTPSFLRSAEPRHARNISMPSLAKASADIDSPNPSTTEGFRVEIRDGMDEQTFGH
ncbi:uncharacterized protein PAC_01842 [Phialocephala subalpina]|uniref:Nuclear membrane fusion protein Kar5 n=1 Tax=Phialocephala subalpina TaxID=576137 RepID=A0A1L7WGR5_9HELO|nr:uncharacterized protein PAC_01842 [Phialocephala subalpina]